MRVEYIRLLIDHDRIDDIPNHPDLRKTVNTRFRDGDQIAIVPVPGSAKNFHLFRVAIDTDSEGNLTVTRNHVGEIQLREMLI